MISFKQFITEAEVLHSRENSALKGTMHELLVGHFLMNAPSHQHPDDWKPSSPDQPKFPQRPKGNEDKWSSEEVHDTLRSRMPTPTYELHVEAAKVAAEKIRGQIQKTFQANTDRFPVHWTAHPKAVHELIRTDDSSPADLIVSKKKRKTPHLTVEPIPKNYAGVTLKFQKKSRAPTINNLGHEKMDSITGISTKHHIATNLKPTLRLAQAETEGHAHGEWDLPQLMKRFDVSNRDDLDKSLADDPYLGKAARAHAAEARLAAADDHRKVYSQMRPHELADVLRVWANIGNNKMPLFKSVTTGTHSFQNETVETKDEIDRVLAKHGPHLHVKLQDPGKRRTSRITMHGEGGVPIASLSITNKGRTVVRGLRGTVTGINAIAKQ